MIMTKPEQQQLKTIVEQLEAVQRNAPSVAVVRNGSTNASVAFQLIDVIRNLKALAGDNEPETA
jgi:hypothetical protein